MSVKGVGGPGAALDLRTLSSLVEGTPAPPVWRRVSVVDGLVLPIADPLGPVVARVEEDDIHGGRGWVGEGDGVVTELGS